MKFLAFSAIKIESMPRKMSAIGFQLLLPLLLMAQTGQDGIIQVINEKLKTGKLTVSGVLTDTSLMYLHANPNFREVVKQNANTDTVRITSDSEPGVLITIKATIKTPTGEPLNDALVYFYQTSNKGWYSDTAVHISGREGDHRHARLFGYVRTNGDGDFYIKTTRPNGYPKSNLAAHIHIQVWDNNDRQRIVPGELQFEDDPRMTPSRKQRSIAEGFLIAPNSGSEIIPFYNYTIVTKN